MLDKFDICTKNKRSSACISSNLAHFDSSIGEIEVF